MGGGEGLRLDGRPRESAYLTGADLPEITAEDQKNRKTDIERRTQELVASGVEIKKAKRQATTAFDKANPAFTEGKSRGKRHACSLLS